MVTIMGVLKAVALTILMSTGITVVTGMCPTKCVCVNENMVNCSMVDYTTIPHFLNPSVVVLDMSRSNISKLDSNLHFYDHLESLNLSHSKLHSLSTNQFIMQVKMKDLQAEGNFIQEIEEGAFYGLQHLKELNLKSNEIKRLMNQTFTDLVSLEILDLSKNLIAHIEPEAFRYLDRLRDLRLTRNRIHEVSGWTARLQSITVLSLSQNSVSVLVYNLSLPHLRDLDLSDNRLSEIPAASLAGCPSLERLDLSYNKISSVPPLAGGDDPSAGNLTELALSGNMIRGLDRESLSHLAAVRNLHLNNMPVLANVQPDALANFARLEFLTLANNKKLAPLPGQLFEGTPRLKQLDLSQLGWSSLSPDQVPPQVEILRLGGTKLRCSCSLAWLWNLYQAQPARIQGAECDGQPLADAADTKLRCSSVDYMLIIGIVTGSVVICILLVMIVIVYSCVKSRQSSSAVANEKYRCDYLQYSNGTAGLTTTLRSKKPLNHPGSLPPPFDGGRLDLESSPTRFVAYTNGRMTGHKITSSPQLPVSHQHPSPPVYTNNYEVYEPFHQSTGEMPVPTVNQRQTTTAAAIGDDSNGVAGNGNFLLTSVLESEEPLYYTVTANPLDEYCNGSLTSGYVGSGSAYTSSSAASSESRGTLRRLPIPTTVAVNGSPLQQPPQQLVSSNHHTLQPSSAFQMMASHPASPGSANGTKRPPIAAVEGGKAKGQHLRNTLAANEKRKGLLPRYPDIIKPYNNNTRGQSFLV